MSAPAPARSPRYTVTRALDAWHVFDTRRNEPVAFTASPSEALTRARAECYNHYWHLTLEDKNIGTHPSANARINHP